MTPEDLDAIEKRAAHWYNECDACRAKIPMYETAGWHSSAEGWCEEPTPCETQIAADLRALPAEIRRLRAERERLWADFARFCDHSPLCGAVGMSGSDCDCGLEEALQAARAALGEGTKGKGE